MGYESRPQRYLATISFLVDTYLLSFLEGRLRKTWHHRLALIVCNDTFFRLHWQTRSLTVSVFSSQISPNRSG